MTDTKFTTKLVAEAFEKGRKAAFVAAVEECEAYAAAAQQRIDETAAADGAAGRWPPSMPLTLLGEVHVAKQIAMRIAQRAKRGT